MGVLQIIFVLETNKKTKSDTRYLRKLINQIYDQTSNDITFQYIEMGTKYKYKDRNVLSEINSYLKENKDGINHVLYCFDTDRIDKNPLHVSELKERENYCSFNGYNYVWFCYDIETVFLGHSVPDADKEKESKRFFRNDFNLSKEMINKLSANSDNKTKEYSNILTVLKRIYPFDF